VRKFWTNDVIRRFQFQGWKRDKFKGIEGQYQEVRSKAYNAFKEKEFYLKKAAEAGERGDKRECDLFLT